MITGSIALDWAVFASSLANVILLLWLGLTVLLNGQSRTAGAWLVGATALAGSAFFVAHTAILGISANILVRSLDFWWQLGWAPLLLIPLAWYLMTLWFGGFWSIPTTALRRRHRALLWAAIALFLLLVGLFLFATPLPTFQQTLALQFTSASAIGGAPILLIIYPIYIIACISLAFDALRHPAPATRSAGDEARRRAQPWLLATSAVLLAVSLLVAATIGLVVAGALPGRLNTVSLPAATLGTVLAWLDLLIALLITLATILVGQAVISYELFTGFALPRGELRRHWRNTLLLAVGFGVIVGGSVAWHVRFVYSVLLATLLMTVFYALFGWRTFARQEEFMRRLRPFVASPRLSEQLLAPAGGNLAPPSPWTVDVTAPFAALCADVLHTTYAVLAALGPIAPLVNPPLVYPHQAESPGKELQTLAATLSAATTPLVAVTTVGGVRWAVPLWSARGLIGALLLGDKQGGSLYTQEEIEIARATGERLIDGRASAAISQRLLILQRQRLTESRVLDRQTRRVLHDEVLPLLHTALLNTAKTETAPLLADAHRRIANLLRDLPLHAVPTVDEGLLAALRHAVERELAGQFDGVIWSVTAQAEAACAQLAPLTAEVLFYAGREAMRNAARHGRGGDSGRPLQLAVTVTMQDGLRIVVEDDGVGAEGLGDAGGAGQGLALHRDLLAVVGAVLELGVGEGGGARVVIQLPEMGASKAILPPM